MAAQFELYPGKLTQVNLLPANCKAGANFGCTSLLSGLTTNMDNGIMTAKTKEVIWNEDGGSENVNWEKHALHLTLIKELETVENLYVPRLPPEHHHDWADTTISVVEDKLSQPGGEGIETLPDMVAFIQRVFAESKAYGKTVVKVQMHMANYNFTDLFDGCVDSAFPAAALPTPCMFQSKPERHLNAQLNRKAALADFSNDDTVRDLTVTGPRVYG